MMDKVELNHWHIASVYNHQWWFVRASVYMSICILNKREQDLLLARACPLLDLLSIISGREVEAEEAGYRDREMSACCV